MYTLYPGVFWGRKYGVAATSSAVASRFTTAHAKSRDWPHFWRPQGPSCATSATSPKWSRSGLSSPTNWSHRKYRTTPRGLVAKSATNRATQPLLSQRHATNRAADSAAPSDTLNATRNSPPKAVNSSYNAAKLK